MAKRTSEQTATAAINRLFPSEHPGDARSKLKQANFRAEDLRDALVDGKKIVEDTLRTFKDAEMVHVSVAAVYCRRSENTFGNAVKKKGHTYSDLKASGQAEKKSGKRYGGGNDTELFYRMGFVKEMAAFLESVEKNANKSRSEAAKKRATKQNLKGAQHATRIPMLWLVDNQGRVYCNIKFNDKSGRERAGVLIRAGARIDIMTLQAAMTERVWRDTTARAEWSREYLRILDAERELERLRAIESDALRLDIEQPAAKAALPRSRL